MDGWNTKFPLGMSYFQGRTFSFGGVCNFLFGLLFSKHLFNYTIPQIMGNMGIYMPYQSYSWPSIWIIFRKQGKINVQSSGGNAWRISFCADQVFAFFLQVHWNHMFCYFFSCGIFPGFAESEWAKRGRTKSSSVKIGRQVALFLSKTVQCPKILHQMHADGGINYLMQDLFYQQLSPPWYLKCNVLGARCFFAYRHLEVYNLCNYSHAEAK